MKDPAKVICFLETQHKLVLKGGKEGRYCICFVPADEYHRHDFKELAAIIRNEIRANEKNELCYRDLIALFANLHSTMVNFYSEQTDGEPEWWKKVRESNFHEMEIKNTCKIKGIKSRK